MRGWGPEQFARATPEYMAALRWGLYAERAVPILAGWKAVQAIPTNEATPEQLTQKLDAAKVVPLLTDLLYPEDDDGE